MRLNIIILCCLLLLLFSCKKQETQATQKPLILVSIHPYELLVRQMVGDGFEVRSLIPANASPHTWSAHPADLRDLNKADLVITNGLGLENSLAQSLASIKDNHLICAELLRDLVALDSLKQVKKQIMHHEHEAEIEHEHEHEEGHNHVHSGTDPHLWTSPLLMQKLATKLKALLVEKFPEFAPVINHNTDEVIADLGKAHEKISSERLSLVSPALVTYHNSFHHFTEEYRIEYLGWVQSSPGKEPTAKELAELGKKIKEHKVKTIFTEPQQNPKSAEILAKEYSLAIKTLDPLGASFGVKTISELILANWAVMRNGL